jgi:cell division protein FtsB
LRISELEAQEGKAKRGEELRQQSLLVAGIDTAAKEKAALQKTNEKLRQTNRRLSEEIDRLKAAMHGAAG